MGTSDIHPFRPYTLVSGVYARGGLGLQIGSTVFATARVTNGVGLYRLVNSEGVTISPQPRLEVFIFPDRCLSGSSYNVVMVCISFNICCLSIYTVKGEGLLSSFSVSYLLFFSWSPSVCLSVYPLFSLSVPIASMHTHTHSLTLPHTHTHTHAHTHICTYAHAHTHIRTCTHTQSTHTHKHTHTHAHTHTHMYELKE